MAREENSEYSLCILPVKVKSFFPFLLCAGFRNHKVAEYRSNLDPDPQHCLIDSPTGRGCSDHNCRRHL